MKTCLYIGRFQGFDSDHTKEVKKLLKKYDRIILGIRDTQRDENNELSREVRLRQIHKALPVKNYPNIDKMFVNDLGADLTVHFADDTKCA